MHLVRALGDEAVVYRPYDLLIVNPRDTGHDYYTMSAAGTQLATLCASIGTLPTGAAPPPR